MHVALCTAISLTALTLTSISADALSLRMGHGDKLTTFSSLSLIDGNPDNGICAKRYGKGFTVKAHPGSLPEQRKFITYEGHEITMTHVGGNLGDGVYSLENEYPFTFPGDTHSKPVKFQLIATGLIGDGQASGVFSDETCRGSVLITLVQGTAAQ